MTDKTSYSKVYLFGGKLQKWLKEDAPLDGWLK
jgi:hypothetical protein